MRETREQMAARLDEYADVWANEGTPDADVTALRAGAAALLAQGWQPIETAPKDGTTVIVALISDGRVQRVSDARFSGVGWYTRNGGVACHWRTHWMPLPSPPEAD